MELLYILAILSRNWLVLAGVAGATGYAIFNSHHWWAVGGGVVLVVMLLLRKE